MLRLKNVEKKDLEQKCDAPGILFGFNQANKENKEKNGFLKRRPKQVKPEELHEGVFWVSQKNRGIIESRILNRSTIVLFEIF